MCGTYIGRWTTREAVEVDQVYNSVLAWGRLGRVRVRVRARAGCVTARVRVRKMF